MKDKERARRRVASTWGARKAYYFCMEADLKAFLAGPEKYVSMLRLLRAHPVWSGLGYREVALRRLSRPGLTGTN